MGVYVCECGGSDCPLCAMSRKIQRHFDSMGHGGEDILDNPKTPVGEEPAPGRQDVGTCNGNQREVANSPGPVPSLHSSQSPPGIKPALAPQSGPALSRYANNARFGWDAAIGEERTVTSVYEVGRGPDGTLQMDLIEMMTAGDKPLDDCGLPTTDNPPGPEDKDLRDYDDDNDWRAFVRDSWDELLSWPVRFDLETGEPGLVPREEIQLALAAGCPRVDQVLFSKRSPSEWE